MADVYQDLDAAGRLLESLTHRLEECYEWCHAGGNDSRGKPVTAKQMDDLRDSLRDTTADCKRVIKSLPGYATPDSGGVTVATAQLGSGDVDTTAESYCHGAVKLAETIEGRLAALWDRPRKPKVCDLLRRLREPMEHVVWDEVQTRIGRELNVARRQAMAVGVEAAQESPPPGTDTPSLTAAAIAWLAKRYNRGRPGFSGGALHTFLENRTGFRRRPKDQHEADELSALSERFVGVLISLVDFGYATHEGEGRVSFGSNFRATVKVIEEAARTNESGANADKSDASAKKAAKKTQRKSTNDALVRFAESRLAKNHKYPMISRAWNELHGDDPKSPEAIRGAVKYARTKKKSGQVS